MLRAITFRSRRKSLSAFYAHAYEPVCKFLRPNYVSRQKYV